MKDGDAVGAVLGAGRKALQESYLPSDIKCGRNQLLQKMHPLIFQSGLCYRLWGFYIGCVVQATSLFVVS